MPLPPVRMQRARGRAEVAVARRDGAVRLTRLHQEGCAKALLPRPNGPVPEVVLINTAGGLTGGDRLEITLAAGPGAALVATTQAAERVYRSLPGAAPARVAVRLRLGAGAALDWLPQETILFQAGRLSRTLEVDMAADARLTLLETLVLGRTAMGETVTEGHFVDQWRVRRAGGLIHAEALRLTGQIARAGAGPATLGGARAMATLIHVAPDAALRLSALRASLPSGPGVSAGASLRGDVLILRLFGVELAPLRDALAVCLAALRVLPPPHVWSH